MTMISTISAAARSRLSPLWLQQNATRTTTMMIRCSAVRNAVGFRPMTILSKQTAEEFKKQVQQLY